MVSHTVTTVWVENMQFETDNPNGHKALIDTTKEHGGNSSGLGPKAMMLSSLAGCSGLDIVSLFKKKRVVIDDFKIEITGELTDEHPKYYHTVSVGFYFYGTNLDENKINKVVNLSVDKYCGVMEMFRKFATVKTAVHFHKN